MTQDTDEELYRGIVQRDGRSLQRLLDRYAEPLMAVMWRRIKAHGQPEDLQDLLQQTAIKVWRTIDRFNPEKGSFKTWTFQIAVSYAEESRRKSVRRRNLLANNPGVIPEPRTQDYEAFLERTGSESARTQLDDAIGKMKESDQELLTLHLQGLDHQDIADHLGEKVGTIRTRFHRAKNRLRKLISKR